VVICSTGTCILVVLHVVIYCYWYMFNVVTQHLNMDGPHCYITEPTLLQSFEDHPQNTLLRQRLVHAKPTLLHVVRGLRHVPGTRGTTSLPGSETSIQTTDPSRIPPSADLCPTTLRGQDLPVDASTQAACRRVRQAAARSWTMAPVDLSKRHSLTSAASSGCRLSVNLATCVLRNTRVFLRYV